MLLTPLLLPGLAVAAQIFNNDKSDAPRYIFTFGDSYTSTGFRVDALPHPRPAAPMGNVAFPGLTSDNGENWLSHVISISPPNTLSYNFAHGGAVVDETLIAPLYMGLGANFADEVRLFSESVARHPAYARWTGDNSVFVVWFGVNDMAQSWAVPRTQFLYKAVMESYFKRVRVLYASGARHFVFMTMPPLLKYPWGHERTRRERDVVRQSIRTWDETLVKYARRFERNHKDATVHMLDVSAAYTRVLDHPETHGAPNAFCRAEDGLSCLWHDGFHPGQEVHKSVGTEVFTMLTTMGFYD